LAMKTEYGYWEGGTENFTWERAKRWHEERSKMTTTQTQIRTLPLEALVFSQTPMQVERRKMRTKEQISERAESIKSVGVLQPILVRPNPFREVEEESFEVAAGEGRVLSAKEAGLEEIPAIVRELTDEQVEEIQLIENLQRDDVHELVEALGYETLLKHGNTVDQIAEKVGKSKRTIYTRLQLRKLDPATHDAFRSGRIDFSKALLVARLPAAVDQRKAGIEIADMPYLRAREHIEREYMLMLKDAPFDTADAVLLKNTPACGPCSKRTGNQPELFGDVKSADVCTDKRCYQAKCEAGARLKLALARDNGQKIITGAEAKKVLPYQHMDHIGAGYVKPSEKCWDDPKQRTYAQIFGKDFKPTLVQSPYDKGNLVEVVEKSAAIKKLHDDGVLKAPKASFNPERTKTATASSKAANEKAKREEEIDQEAAHRLYLAVHAKAPKALAQPTLVAIALQMLDELEYDDRPAWIFKAWRWSENGPSPADLKKLKEAQLNQVIFELFLFHRNASSDLLESTAKRMGIDPKKIRAEVRASLLPPAPAKASKKKASKK
jgi:ParB/RepB/Spo0J family partition protein